MKNPDLSREQTLLEQGFSFVAGIDEVGRGCWAGPVVAGAVIFNLDPNFLNSQLSILNLIRDSKTLSKKKREELNLFIKENSIWAIGECSSQEVDRLGIAPATREAMKRAILGLKQRPDYLLIDGRDQLNTTIPQQAIIDGDALSTTIAAASIIAKVYRDQLMTQMGETYPGYHFASHVGYGTAAHIKSLTELGICDLHRQSYKPIQKYL